MAKRRLLRGKKLLVAAGIAGASFISCDGETVANLVAPPDSGAMDAEVPEDANIMGLPDAPIANLVAPPDSGTDAGETSDDAGDAPIDAQVIDFPDGAVANLLPPPDGSF